MRSKPSVPIYKITHTKSGWSVEGKRHEAQAKAAHYCFVYSQSMDDLETSIVAYEYGTNYENKML